MKWKRSRSGVIPPPRSLVCVLVNTWISVLLIFAEDPRARGSFAFVDRNAMPRSGGRNAGVHSVSSVAQLALGQPVEQGTGRDAQPIGEPHEGQGTGVALTPLDPSQLRRVEVDAVA
jgi:hypothetical protein